MKRIEKLSGSWLLVEIIKFNEYKHIYLPDSQASRVPYVRILAAGPKAAPSMKPGRIAIVMAQSSWKNNSFKREGVEMLFIPSVEGKAIKAPSGKIIPTGKRIMIRRVYEDPCHREVYIPEQWSREQTLWGEVVAFGTEIEHTSLKVGSYVRLLQWEHHMFEISLSGVYHLIVEQKDIMLEVEDPLIS